MTYLRKIKLFVICLIIAPISGCYLVTNKPLHNGWDSYTLNSFFGSGRHAFMSNDGDYGMWVSVGDTQAVATKTNFKAQSTSKAEAPFKISKVVRRSDMPAGRYFALSRSSKGAYFYALFIYHNKDSFTYYHLAGRDDPTTPNALAWHAKEGFPVHGGISFKRVYGEQEKRVYRLAHNLKLTPPAPRNTEPTEAQMRQAMMNLWNKKGGQLTGLHGVKVEKIQKKGCNRLSDNEYRCAYFVQFNANCEVNPLMCLAMLPSLGGDESAGKFTRYGTHWVFSGSGS